ncbi:right-handed parallel beta-helix repeat-containing protein [Candidatus Cyanaurora vandensis]|uniref:right-handed parallel beta-helix repeat-containing protein n=1 Tax=Candidatus Cyanaurora vandensis TaxID=2714958 RepID=UPI00257FB0B8|nr:right-handed parallel beta-helix repeat-containing protein [Candidatus Cyanaurora vandensis]
MGWRYGFLVGVLALGLEVQAATVYVATDGKDSWSGKLARPNAAKTDGPLATLGAAQNTIRKLKPRREPMRVVVAGGRYILNQPLTFAPQDSGTARNPVSYEAAPGARPVFSGGKAVRNFKRNPDGTWSATVAPDWRFEQLFVDGKRATRARTPNKFYFYVKDKVPSGIDPLTGSPADLRSRAFRARPGDLTSLPAGTPALRDAVVVVYHSWEVSRLPIATVDPQSHTLITTAGMSWQFLNWGANQRYHLENYQAALDIPGEWYLDRQGRLTYFPLPGEDMTKAEVIAPVVEQFVRFNGAPTQKVEYITLKGLTFHHGQYLQLPQGYSSGQASYWIGAMIEADHAQHIAIQDTEIAHIGNYAVWLRRGCNDCRVERSYLWDLGAGGVKVGDWQEPKLVDYSGNNVVDNNIIRSGGHIFTGAVGVWVGHSGDNRISHNDISDLNYSGISVGWRWGYQESLAKRNRLSFNRIHDVGRGVLNDLGGIYTLGPSQGTVINNNVIANVYSFGSYGRGGWGIYTDEGTTGILIENNLVYNVMTGGYHQHYGKDNIVRNNIFALSNDGQLQLSNLEQHRQVIFTNNIVYWQKSDLFIGIWGRSKAELANNLYFKVGGTPALFEGKTLGAWQRSGRDKGSLVADPQFLNPALGDFRLKPGSPARKLGFKPFDPSQAGVYGKASWVKLSRSVVLPPVDYPAPGSAVAFNR